MAISNNKQASKMMKHGILTASAIALLGTATFAQTPSSTQAETVAAVEDGLASTEQVDLSQVTCWDAVTLAEDDRASTMLLLYGYVLGLQKQTTISPQDIQITIVNTMMTCVDTPDKKLLALLKTKIASRASEE